MRNFLVESLHLVAQSLGLEMGEPSYESEPILSEIRRENAGYTVEPGTICGHIRTAKAALPGGGQLVSLWRGMFDLQPDRDGMAGGAKVVVVGEPNFEVVASGDLFLDTYPPTGARAVAAVRPLRLLEPGLHTIDELPQHPGYL
jgi:2,4-diaminopentanoate dehydrogenase C-terminal domain